LKDMGLGVKGLILSGHEVLILVKPNGTSDFPGGKVESGENHIQALDREIIEETGLTVKIYDPIAQWSFTKSSGLQINGVTYLCQYLRGQVSLSDEHCDFYWLPLSKISTVEPGQGFSQQGEVQKLNFYGLHRVTQYSNAYFNWRHLFYADAKRKCCDDITDLSSRRLATNRY
jgi:8-oxo-dGTP diphosphatase